MFYWKINISQAESNVYQYRMYLLLLAISR